MDDANGHNSVRQGRNRLKDAAHKATLCRDRDTWRYQRKSTQFERAVFTVLDHVGNVEQHLPNIGDIAVETLVNEMYRCALCFQTPDALRFNAPTFSEK